MRGATNNAGDSLTPSHCAETSWDTDDQKAQAHWRARYDRMPERGLAAAQPFDKRLARTGTPEDAR